MKNEWKRIKKYLPNGWEEKAKEEGAFQRSRGIKNAEELLMLNLLYVADGGSYQATSEMMRLTAGIKMNKNATRNRIKGSWKWLKWITQEMCRKQGYLGEKPEWLADRHVVLVDASDMSIPGSQGSDYRLHTAFDLFEFQYRTLEITTNKTGEKLSLHAVKAEDIVIADRTYCTIAGMEHVTKAQGHFILRYRSKGFRLYDEQGNQMELLPSLRGLSALESTQLTCYYRLPNGHLRPVRVIAMKKQAEAIADSERKKLYKIRNRQKKPVSEETMELNQYIVLVTDLHDAEDRILELYRARWQIELVFHRLKSLFGFGEVPSSNPDSVRAWFYGKLLLAVLCETIIKTETFSPKEEKLFFGFVSQKSME